MHKKLIFAIISITCFLSNMNAQCVGFSKEELKEFGPWLCPEYFPSPGFPGNPNPITLPEVEIKPSNPSTPSNPYYPYPTTPTPTPGSNSGNQNTKIPCLGDPRPSPTLAPSGGWNYEGGTYGYTRNGGKRFHDGIDIKATPGDQLYSMYDGIVTAIRRSFSPGEYRENSYGNFIMIKSTINGKVVYLKYNHLDGIANNLNVGDQVMQRELIGICGKTGNAASPSTRIIPHVHIQAKDEAGKKIDPEPYVATKFNHKTGAGTSPCNE